MDAENSIIEKDYKNKALFSMSQGVMPWTTLDEMDAEDLNEDTASSFETRKMLSNLGLTESKKHIRHIERNDYLWS